MIFILGRLLLPLTSVLLIPIHKLLILDLHLLIYSLTHGHIPYQLFNGAGHCVHFRFNLVPLLAFAFVDELDELVTAHLFVTLLFQLFYEVDDVAGACALEDVFLEFEVLLLVFLLADLAKFLVAML